MSTPELPPRVTYNVTFGTAHTTITTTVVLDDSTDLDYLLDAALELLNEELHADIEYLSATVERDPEE